MLFRSGLADSHLCGLRSFGSFGYLKIVTEYAYNQLGQQIIRRLTQTVVTIQSVYGPDGNRIAEYNEATGALIRQYIWLEGAPIAVVEGGRGQLRALRPHRPPGVCDQQHGGQSLDRRLPAVRRRASLDRDAADRPLSRPVVPVRDGLAPELDAGL